MTLQYKFFDLLFAQGIRLYNMSKITRYIHHFIKEKPPVAVTAYNPKDLFIGFGN